MGAYAIGAYIGGLFITFLLTRLVLKLFGDRGNQVITALLTFVILSAVSMVATSQTMGINAAFTVYIPCLTFWLVFDIFRALRAS